MPAREEREFKRRPLVAAFPFPAEEGALGHETVGLELAAAIGFAPNRQGVEDVALDQSAWRVRIKDRPATRAAVDLGRDFDKGPALTPEERERLYFQSASTLKS